jgi:hypothetical protein
MKHQVEETEGKMKNQICRNSREDEMPDLQKQSEYY